MQLRQELAARVDADERRHRHLLAVDVDVEVLVDVDHLALRAERVEAEDRQPVGSTAELESQGGGPVWRPGIASHGMGAALEVDADEPRVRTTPRTIPTIASTTTPPAMSQVRLTRGADAPVDRTGGGVRRGGGPSPAFFLADCFAIGARSYQRRGRVGSPQRAAFSWLPPCRAPG